jgi:hypothetical protein
MRRATHSRIEETVFAVGDLVGGEVDDGKRMGGGKKVRASKEGNGRMGKERDRGEDGD